MSGDWTYECSRAHRVSKTFESVRLLMVAKAMGRDVLLDRPIREKGGREGEKGDQV